MQTLGYHGKKCLKYVIMTRITMMMMVMIMTMMVMMKKMMMILTQISTRSAFFQHSPLLTTV